MFTLLSITLSVSALFANLLVLIAFLYHKLRVLRVTGNSKNFESRDPPLKWRILNFFDLVFSRTMIDIFFFFDRNGNFLFSFFNINICSVLRNGTVTSMKFLFVYLCLRCFFNCVFFFFPFFFFNCCNCECCCNL